MNLENHIIVKKLRDLVQLADARVSVSGRRKGTTILPVKERPRETVAVRAKSMYEKMGAISSDGCLIKKQDKEVEILNDEIEFQFIEEFKISLTQHCGFIDNLSK